MPDVDLAAQAAEMQRLREAQNAISDGYLYRDELMVAFALSNSVSRLDMALATGLAKSRVDQIIRETHSRIRSQSARVASALR